MLIARKRPELRLVPPFASILFRLVSAWVLLPGFMLDRSVMSLACGHQQLRSSRTPR